MTLRKLIFALLLLFAGSAQAQLSIEITGAGANQIPVAVSRFAGEDALAQSISDVIEGDLQRSGRFKMLYAGNVSPLPSEINQVSFADWKNRNADALVIGAVSRLPDGRFEVRFRLLDVPKQAQLGGVAFAMTAAQVRTTGHRIADFIYEKLTGERGVFSTRIAYVIKQAQRFELQIADADGQGAQTALASREPIISPAWSPDGTRLAYVSFENKKPVVFVHSLTTGMRQVVANFKGSNSAPSWAPDGKQLAVVLSRDGGSQIYLVNADGSNVRRLTTTGSIDTEPYFSPDGQTIYFTSDRGGSPQIYRMPATGGDAQRVTFEGTYNVSARISPDGKRRVVESLLRRGRYVAMVGDGVNDVPALKASRLSIAQGSGTQMARSVSDLVLVSGEFGEVPPMVGEGRQILRNIQRVARLFVSKAVFTGVP